MQVSGIPMASSGQPLASKPDQQQFNGQDINLQNLATAESNKITTANKIVAEPVKEKVQESVPEFTIYTTNTLGKNLSSQNLYAQEKLNAFHSLSTVIPKIASNFTAKLEQLSEALENEISGLKNKEWDFTLNDNNEIVIIGEDLTATQTKQIEQKVVSSSVVQDMVKLRDELIYALEQERGAAQYSETMARYDLNKENFAEVFRFGEFSAKVAETSYGNAAFAIADQLEARGTEKYNWQERTYLHQPVNQTI